MKTLVLFLFVLSPVLLFSQNSKLSAEIGVGLDGLKFGESKEKMIEQFGIPDDSVMFMGCTCYYNYYKEGISIGIYNTGKIIQFVLKNDEIAPPLPKKFEPFSGALKEGISIHSKWEDVVKVYGKPDEIIEKGDKNTPLLEAHYFEKSIGFLISKDYSKIYYIVFGAQAND